MISVPCVCGRSVGYENAGPGWPVRCACGQIVRPAWGGTRTPDMAFTGRLVVRSGPTRVGEHFVLGGDGPIEVGKLAGKPILLNGDSVSRGHCRLVRQGGHWHVEDQRSTNGLFVDGNRTERAPLRDGSILDIGEFEVHFASVATAKATAGTPARPAMARAAAPVATAPPPRQEPIGLQPDDADDEVLELEPIEPIDEPVAVSKKEEPADEPDELYDLIDALDTEPKKPSTASVMNSPAVMASRRPLGAPTMASASRMAATAPVSGPPVVCPSCAKRLAPGSKICVDCGIYTATGRPLVTAKGLDEDDLAITAHNWISAVSWVMRFGLFPIASEAFGTFKPRAIKAIAWVTVAASLLFFVGYHLSGDDEIEKMNSGIAGLMQWGGRQPAVVDASDDTAPDDPAEVATKALDSLFTKEELATLERIDAKQTNGERLTATERRLMERAERRLQESGLLDFMQPPFEHRFQVHQLFTCAFLHDPGGNIVFGWIPLAYHLGGNLVFMLVFGMAINSLLGDTKMAIVYPVLAVGASLINYVMMSDEPLHPMLGASGAVMGLAGMYFVLFPTSKLRMVIWWRWGFIGKFALHYKMFAVRGFWMLLLWICWNDVIPVVLSNYLQTGSDGVAHWAHLGGFASGAGVAMVLLLARQANSRGGDILSVALGKYAWSILGKPSQWKTEPVPAVRAVPLSYPTVVPEN